MLFLKANSVGEFQKFLGIGFQNLDPVYLIVHFLYVIVPLLIICCVMQGHWTDQSRLTTGINSVPAHQPSTRLAYYVPVISIHKEIIEPECCS